MKINEVAQELVEAMGIDWYKSDTADTFNVEAMKLLERGFSQKEVLNILNNLFYAVASEYGD